MKAAGCMELNVETRDIERMTEFLQAVAVKAGMQARNLQQLRMAAEEAMSNIVNYSGANKLLMQIWLLPNRLKLAFTDNGVLFDPTTVSEPNLSIPGKERPIGGLGIHYIRQMSDGLCYRRDGGKNILTIIKNL